MALEIKDQDLFNKVVSDAIQNAIQNCSTEKMAKRWERAIDRAVTEIEENPYMKYDEAKNELLVLSPTSNNIYSSNGVCQCLAYLNGKMPCWHRAAARVWRLYLEAQNTPPPTAPAAAVAKASMNTAPYLKGNPNAKTEKIGNIRF